MPIGARTPQVSWVGQAFDVLLRNHGFVLFVFWLLIARIVVEFVRSFSRDWHPRSVTVVILELIMTITDPPVKLLRRLIPQLNLGAVRINLSIMPFVVGGFLPAVPRFRGGRPRVFENSLILTPAPQP